MPRRGTVWLAVAFVVLGAAIVSLVAIAHGRLSETDGRIIATLLVALLAGGAAIAGIELIERRRIRPLAWLVLGGAIVEFGFMEIGVWTFVDESENRYLKWGWTALFWVLPTILIPTAVLFIRSRQFERSLVPLIAACSIAVAGLLTALLWMGGNHDSTGRLTAALAVVLVTGYLVGPALERGLPRGN